MRFSNRLGHRYEWELTLPSAVLQADNPENESLLFLLRKQLKEEKQGLDYALARVEQHKQQIYYLEQRMMNVNVRQKRAKPAQKGRKKGKWCKPLPLFASSFTAPASLFYVAHSHSSSIAPDNQSACPVFQVSCPRPFNAVYGFHCRLFRRMPVPSQVPQ